MSTPVAKVNSDNTTTTNSKAAKTPKACKFIFTQRGCHSGSKCDFSHDPDIVNKQYQLRHPLRWCLNSAVCAQVTTFEYCYECFVEIRRAKNEEARAVREQNVVNTDDYRYHPYEEPESRKCANTSCDNMTTREKCTPCHKLESRYVVHNHTNQFNRR